MPIKEHNRKNINYRVDRIHITPLKFLELINYLKSEEWFITKSVNIGISNEKKSFSGNVENLVNEIELIKNEIFNNYSLVVWNPRPNENSEQFQFNYSIAYQTSTIQINCDNLDDNKFNNILKISKQIFPEIQLSQVYSQQHLENLDIKLKELKENWDKLDFEKIFKKNLGEENIESLKPIVEDVYSKLTQVNDFGINSVPKNLIYNFFSGVNQFFQNIQSISEMSNENFITQKNSIENRVKQNYENILLNWPQVAAVISLKIQDNNNESIAQIDSIKTDIKNTKEFIDSIKSDYETALTDFKTKFKEELQSSQLISEKNTFENRASSNRKNSNYWLGGSVIIFLLLIILLYCFFINPLLEVHNIDLKFIRNFNNNKLDFSKNILWYQLIKVAFLKLLIISMLVYILTFCIKNYNVEKHNFVINTNKVNSIQSSLYFLNNNLIDNDVKNEIIKLVCQSIFSHQNTGFLGKDSEPSNPIFIDKIIDKIP